MTPIEFLEFKNKLQERRNMEQEATAQPHKLGGTYLQPQDVTSPSYSERKEAGSGNQSTEEARNRSPSPSNQAQLFFGNAAQEKRQQRKPANYGERKPSHKEFYLPVKVPGEKTETETPLYDIHRQVAEKTF